MGANASQLEKDIGSDLFPANEHYFGLVCITIYLVIKLSFYYYLFSLSMGSDLAIIHQFIIVLSPSTLSKDKFEIIMKCLQVNFGNTCYSNSVLQALYFCRPFREKVL